MDRRTKDGGDILKERRRDQDSVCISSHPQPLLSIEKGALRWTASRAEVRRARVPVPEVGESEPEIREDLAGSVRTCGDSKGEIPPWSQGSSPRKGGRDGGSSRRTVGRGKREAGSPSKPLDAGKSASSGGMSPSPEKAIPMAIAQGLGRHQFLELMAKSLPEFEDGFIRHVQDAEEEHLGDVLHDLRRDQAHVVV